MAVKYKVSAKNKNGQTSIIPQVQKPTSSTSGSKQTSNKGSTTNTWSHSYVSTSPNTSLPTYNQQTYSSSTFNKGMPDTYKKNTISSSYLNQDMPGKYKMDTVQAQKYNGPTYNAQEYVSDYKPTEFVNNYKTSQYNSKYMPQIEQRMNDVANWSYDPMQDASYQALAAVYGARGNLAAKNSLADAAALNGGYGTSNAVSAAQQARNQYNQELASMIPQLEQAAYNRAQTGLSAMMDVDNMQYGRFRDTEADKQFAAQLGLDYDKLNADEKRFVEQNRQNVWSMNNDERYRAVQNAMDVFNTNTANQQWADTFNQGERQFRYNSGWDRYNAKNQNRQFAANYNQAENQFGYNSEWDRYNAKNQNRQYVTGLNQNERQFGYNAGMDAAQLLNDYYKWAAGENNALWEWNYAQANKGSSGGGSGGGRSSGGGGGGYSGGGSSSAASTDAPPLTEEDFNNLGKKKNSGAVKSGSVSNENGKALNELLSLKKNKKR